MVQLKNKLEVLGHMSTFIFRGIGFEVVRKDVDEQTHVAELFDKETKETIYVTVTHLQADDYVFTTSVKGREQNNVSCVLNYSQYFKNLKLPISDTKLDKYYDDYKGDWTKTLPGFILFKVGDFSHLEQTLEYDNDQVPGQTSTQKFFFEVVVPNFNKKTELSKEDKIRLIKEIKLKICGIQIIPDDYDGESRATKLHKVQVAQEELLKEAKKTSTSNTNDIDLPKFDDEYELLRNKPTNQPFSSVIPSIGDSDINPLGIKYPSMKPYLDPLSDYNPSNSSGFNGMIPDKSHPLFSGGLGGADINNGGLRGDHPRGSRYDDPLIRDESVELGLPGGSFRGTPFGRSSSGFGNNGPYGGPFGGNIF